MNPVHKTSSSSLTQKVYSHCNRKFSFWATDAQGNPLHATPEKVKQTVLKTICFLVSIFSDPFFERFKNHHSISWVNEDQLKNAIKLWLQEGKLLDKLNQDTRETIYNSRRTCCTRVQPHARSGEFDLSLFFFPGDIPKNGLDSLFTILAPIFNLYSLTLPRYFNTTLPTSIGKLVYLTSLEISGRTLSMLPESIGLLRNLMFLNLQGNRLIDLPKSLGKLHKLQSLNLRCNKLTTLSNDFWNLPENTHIDLRDNQFLENAIEEMNEHLIRRGHNIEINIEEVLPPISNSQLEQTLRYIDRLEAQLDNLFQDNLSSPLNENDLA